MHLGICLYVFIYIRVCMYATIINEKQAMNLKESTEGYMGGGLKGGKRRVN